MKKLFAGFLVALSFFAPGISRAESNPLEADFVISSFKSQVKVDRDGKSEITETITADFGATPHHGIYRTLPTSYPSWLYGKSIGTGIEVKSVKWVVPVFDSLAVPAGKNLVEAPYTITSIIDGVNLKIGDPNRTHIGQVIFQISYTADKVHKVTPEGDRFLWNVTGRNWMVPLENVSVEITAPANWQKGECEVTAGAADCQKNVSGSTFKSTVTKLLPGQELTAGGYLPAATLGPERPKPSPLYFLWPFLIPLAFGYFVYRVKSRLTAKKYSGPVVPEFSAPGIEPALADAFYDGDLLKEPIPAALIEMAAAGIIKIEEEEEAGIILKHKNYVFSKLGQPDPKTAPFATKLYTALFKSSDTITTDTLKKEIRRDPGRALDFTSHLPGSGWDWLIKNGYFSHRDDYGKRLWTLIIGIISFMGSIYTFGFAITAGYTIMLPIALFINGIIGLVGYYLLKGSSLTSAGILMWRKIEGFKLFMHTADRYRQQWLEKQGELDKYLPWAIVFGITEEWLKKLETMNIKFEQPVWFSGTSFDSEAFANSVNSFATSISQASNAGTSSGGAGSGGGGGGGGGW